MPRKTKAENPWAVLAKLEGVPHADLDTFIRIEAEREQVQAAAEPPRRHFGRMRDYVHPENHPSLNRMVHELGNAREEARGYGHLGFSGAIDYALKVETDLYNNWVKYHCKVNNLRSPGELSTADFFDRYWQGEDGEDD